MAFSIGLADAAQPPSDKGDRVVTGGDLAFMNDAAPGHEKRREVFVGLPTMQAILGNKVAPGLLDHYLAKAAYDGQQGRARRSKPAG